MITNKFQFFADKHYQTFFQYFFKTPVVKIGKWTGSLFLSVFIAYFFSTGILAAKENATKLLKQHVLILNSYNSGYNWTDSELNGIKKVFSEHSNIVLHIEYMDSKRISNSFFWQQLSELYKLKYGDYNFDAIISTDDDALQFLKIYRDELFYKVPVIFCGINNFTPDKVTDFSLYTGVNEQEDFISNLKLIQTFHPQARKLYVINDSLTTGKSLKGAFLDAFQKQDVDMKLIFLENLTLYELKTKLASLDPNSIIFYLSLFRDSSGLTFTPFEVIPQFTQVASVPVYGSTDYMLGLGIIGGRLKNSFYQGETAAKLAMHVLNGKEINTIPVVLESPNQYMFDYEQLKRFNIDLDLLPENSQLINEPESFFYHYKQFVFILIGVISFLLIVLFLLLMVIRKTHNGKPLFKKQKLPQLPDNTQEYCDLHSRNSMKKIIDIQMSVMPRFFSRFCTTHDVDLYAYLEPGISTCVDFYDFFSKKKNQLFLVMGTSSGKTIYSSLFMAKAKGLIRSLSRPEMKANELLNNVNRRLANKNKYNQFVNSFLAIVDVEHSLLNYASAGGYHIILVTAEGEIFKPHIKHSIALAVNRNTSYLNQEISIVKYPFILFYSNGVIDIMDNKQQLYGEDKLINALQKACLSSNASAQSITDSLIVDILAFAGNFTQDDDQCLMVFGNKYH